MCSCISSLICVETDKKLELCFRPGCASDAALLGLQETYSAQCFSCDQAKLRQYRQEYKTPSD